MTEPVGISLSLGRQRKFDGKRTALLEAVAKQLLKRKGSVDELILLSRCETAKIQTASNWILKWLLDQQVHFSKSQTQGLVDSLRFVTCWEARLHLLQMINGLEIPSRTGTTLLRLLKEHACDENKLIRAWSYNGLFLLGEQQRRFRNEVGELLNQAQVDPAASVRARVRNICKASNWANRCCSHE